MLIFFTPEFALEISKFQQFPAQLTKGSRNLKSVALKTAEIYRRYKFRPTTGRQRRLRLVTEGKIFALNSFFRYKKS
jgi:hypothetical protein